MSEWMRKHTDLVNQLVEERQAAGKNTTLEGQNTFVLRQPSGLEIKGKPDLVARANDRQTVIPRQDWSSPRFRRGAGQNSTWPVCPSSRRSTGRRHFGEVAYRDGYRIAIEPSDISQDYRSSLQRWIEQIESPTPAKKVDRSTAADSALAEGSIR